MTLKVLYSLVINDYSLEFASSIVQRHFCTYCCDENSIYLDTRFSDSLAFLAGDHRATKVRGYYTTINFVKACSLLDFFFNCFFNLIDFQLCDAINRDLIYFWV